MEAQYVIEKFTRCPQCRSFSLKLSTTEENNRILGLLSDSVYVCNNCGAQFALRGNSLKEISSLLTDKKPEIEKNEPKRIENKPTMRTATWFIFLFCLILGGIFLLLHPWDQDQEQTIAQLPQEVKNTAVENSTDVAEEPQNEELQTTEKSSPTAEEPPGEELQVVEKTSLATEDLPDRELETVEKSVTAAEEPTEELPDINDSSEPTAHKIFDSSGVMKVRKSFPDTTNQSHRWYFKQKAITVKRSKDQRVYIAGDRTGKSKWAVDDEISINGKRIKGCSGEMSDPGYIPESKQMLPVEITHLVPSDRETVLDVKLVDYGILWGNTSLFIVII